MMQPYTGHSVYVPYVPGDIELRLLRLEELQWAQKAEAQVLEQRCIAVLDAQRERYESDIGKLRGKVNELSQKNGTLAAQLRAAADTDTNVLKKIKQMATSRLEETQEIQRKEIASLAVHLRKSELKLEKRMQSVEARTENAFLTLAYIVAFIERVELSSKKSSAV